MRRAGGGRRRRRKKRGRDSRGVPGNVQSSPAAGVKELENSGALTRGAVGGAGKKPRRRYGRQKFRNYPPPSRVRTCARFRFDIKPRANNDRGIITGDGIASCVYINISSERTPVFVRAPHIITTPLFRPPERHNVQFYSGVFYDLSFE